MNVLFMMSGANPPKVTSSISEMENKPEIHGFANSRPEKFTSNQLRPQSPLFIPDWRCRHRTEVVLGNGIPASESAGQE